MFMAKKPAPVDRNGTKSARTSKGQASRAASPDALKEAEIARLYSMSRSEAAKLVKRAGIVTKSGNLSTLFR